MSVVVGYTYPQKRSPPAQASEGKICRERSDQIGPKTGKKDNYGKLFTSGKAYQPDRFGK